MIIAVVIDNTPVEYIGEEIPDFTTWRGELIYNPHILEVAKEVKAGVEAHGHAGVIVPLPHDIPKAIDKINESGCDVIFNLMETAGAESEWEPWIAGVFEVMGFPYTGSGPKTLALALNKQVAKSILRDKGVPVAASCVIDSNDFQWDKQVPFPAIVKPLEEDASWGLTDKSVVNSVKELRTQVRRMRREICNRVMVESYIDGREFNITLIGNPPEVFPLSEIDFKGLPEGHPPIVTYDGKWEPQSPAFQGTAAVVPAPVTEELAEKLRETARKAFAALECRDYARVDTRVDSDGSVYVLEVNPNPDLSSDAGVVNSARVYGWDQAELLTNIVEIAHRRFWGDEYPEGA